MSTICFEFDEEYKDDIKDYISIYNFRRYDGYLNYKENSFEVDTSDINECFKEMPDFIRHKLSFPSLCLGKLKDLWEEFGNIPMDENECIESNFCIWGVGTDRFEIWHWFDERCPNNLHDDIMFKTRYNTNS